MINSEVYITSQMIPRKKTGNNVELVDQVIQLMKKAGVSYRVSVIETTIRGR